MLVISPDMGLGYSPPFRLGLLEFKVRSTSFLLLLLPSSSFPPQHQIKRTDKAPHIPDIWSPRSAQRATPNAPPSFFRIVTSRPNPLPPSSTPDSWSPRSPERPPQMQMTQHIPDRARSGGDRSKSSTFCSLSSCLGIACETVLLTRASRSVAKTGFQTIL